MDFVTRRWRLDLYRLFRTLSPPHQGDLHQLALEPGRLDGELLRSDGDPR